MTRNHTQEQKRNCYSDLIHDNHYWWLKYFCSICICLVVWRMPPPMRLLLTLSSFCFFSFCLFSMMGCCSNEKLCVSTFYRSILIIIMPVFSLFCFCSMYFSDTLKFIIMLDEHNVKNQNQRWIKWVRYVLRTYYNKNSVTDERKRKKKKKIETNPFFSETSRKFYFLFIYVSTRKHWAFPPYFFFLRNNKALTHFNRHWRCLSNVLLVFIRHSEFSFIYYRIASCRTCTITFERTNRPSGL